jgi:hypothetical protein
MKDCCSVCWRYSFGPSHVQLSRGIIHVSFTSVSRRPHSESGLCQNCSTTSAPPNKSTMESPCCCNTCSKGCSYLDRKSAGVIFVAIAVGKIGLSMPAESKGKSPFTSRGPTNRTPSNSPAPDFKSGKKTTSPSLTAKLGGASIGFANA